MADADPIGVAFVGLGRIASLLEEDPLREKPASHAGAFSRLDRCTIVGGFDLDRSRAERFSARWGGLAADSVESLIGRTRPDILVVATHPDSHPHYLRRAVNAAVPVVVMEKPIANTRRAARAMARMERSSNTKVVVNHERRFSHDYQLVRNAIDDERFGALIGVRARLYFGRSARHDRVFLHDGTHLVDAIHFLTRDVIHLQRRIGAYRSARSSVVLAGRLRSRDVPVTIEIGSERDYLHLEIELSFQSGEIRVGNGVFEWRESRPSPYYEGYRSLHRLNRYPPYPTGYFLRMAETAQRLATDRALASPSSISDGAAAVEVIQRAGRLLW